MSNKSTYIRLSASQSFSEDELALLEFIEKTLLRGGDAQVAVRNKNFASLCRKTAAMRDRVTNQKRLRDEAGGVHRTEDPGDDT
jgi:hypothetical protein